MFETFTVLIPFAQCLSSSLCVRTCPASRNVPLRGGFGVTDLDGDCVKAETGVLLSKMSGLYQSVSVRHAVQPSLPWTRF